LNCTNWDSPTLAPTDGAAGCCTDPCEVIASGFSLWSMLDVTDPKGGVQLKYSSLGSLADDPFDCGTDKTGVLKIQRQTTINLYCGAASPNGRPTGIKATEISTCHYLIEVRARTRRVTF